MFQSIQEFENHLNSMAQSDESHRVFYTVYRSIIIQYNQQASRMFDEYIRKVEFVEAKIKSLKRPSSDTLEKLLNILYEGLNEIRPMPSEISKSIYESIVSSIKSLLESPITSKKEALSVVSRIKKIFIPKNQEYFSTLIKAALIMSQRFLIEV